MPAARHAGLCCLLVALFLGGTLLAIYADDAPEPYLLDDLPLWQASRLCSELGGRFSVRVDVQSNEIVRMQCDSAALVDSGGNSPFNDRTDNKEWRQ